MRWSAVADDGGKTLTKYVVFASTAYADTNVEVISVVDVATSGQEPATETTVTGLTNGLVYSFQVIAVNAFGSSARSLPSNKVCLHIGSGVCLCIGEKGMGPRGRCCICPSSTGISGPDRAFSTLRVDFFFILFFSSLFVWW